jgi:hypothetical protein
MMPFVDQVVAGQIGLMGVAHEEKKGFLIFILFQMNSEVEIKYRKYLGVFGKYEFFSRNRLGHVAQLLLLTL